MDKERTTQEGQVTYLAGTARRPGYLPALAQLVRDVVEVYGPHNSVNDAARLAGTISYELTCAVSKRVPRIYMKNGQEVARELLLRE